MFSVTMTINGNSTTFHGSSIHKLVERAKRDIRHFAIFSKMHSFGIAGAKGGEQLFTVDAVWFCHMYYNETPELREFVQDTSLFLQRT